MSDKVFVTGGSGFIGRSVVKTAMECGFRVVAPLRRPGVFSPDGLLECPLISNLSDAARYLADVTTVVHVAGHAHRRKNDGNLNLPRQINYQATTELAQKAANKGVRRFVFISSISVYGGYMGIPFSHVDSTAPESEYGLAKAEAEQALMEICRQSGMDFVIVRPPLVYGADAPGNFGKLLKLTQLGIPLPLGAVDNRRSYVGLDNLTDLIIKCISHPRAANQVFLASDDDDLSTTRLLRIMSFVSNKKLLLMPVPVSSLRVLAAIVGQRAIAHQLLGSLTLDITHTRETLSWTPPLSVEDGIRRCFEM